MAPSIRFVRPVRRALNGILLLDKPVGPSSHDALMRVKHLFSALKAGHTGTLDPLASGLLPLCFGEATKFAQDLLDAEKCYEATVALGTITTTGDTQGEIVSTRSVRCTLNAIRATLARFQGEIMQIPPMYSALKRDGKPLYTYARRGLTLNRPARPVTIKALELFDASLCPSSRSLAHFSVKLPKEHTRRYENSEATPCTPLPHVREPNTNTIQIRVVCSKGTYIRTLAQDIGEALGCGAHLSALRRIGVGRFSIADSVTLDALAHTDAAERTLHLQPVDTLLLTYPTARLDAHLADRFKQGQSLRLASDFNFEAPIVLSHTTPTSTQAPVLRVRVYDETGCLLGTGRFNAGVLTPQRLVSTTVSTF